MTTTEDLITELKDEYNKCEELFNIAWKLNDDENTRTAFTQRVTTYMSEVIQTLGFLIAEQQLLYYKENDVKVIEEIEKSLHKGLERFCDYLSDIGIFLDSKEVAEMPDGIDDAWETLDNYFTKLLWQERINK